MPPNAPTRGCLVGIALSVAVVWPACIALAALAALVAVLLF